MSRDGRQRERERESSDESGHSERRRSGGSGRVTVSDRSSWSGLAKRAYNVAVGSRSGRSRSGGGNLELAGLMIAGAVVGGLLPVPFAWLAGVAGGAALGGRRGSGSSLFAVGSGAVLGFLFGLAFAPVLFGLGFLFTLLLTVVAAVVAGVGYLAGE